jgi:hypothetical protein
MPISIDSLVAIVQSGGGFEIDAKKYAAAVLLPFIGQMNQGAVLRVRNATTWKVEDVVAVARTAPPGVAQFVF